MGGHGALTIALKNPAAYKSVSAFAPICNPTQVPWGHKVRPQGGGRWCPFKRASPKSRPCFTLAVVPRGCGGRVRQLRLQATMSRCARVSGAPGWQPYACSPTAPSHTLGPTPQAFAGYLGEGWEAAAEQHDATLLAKRYNGPQLPVLMDTGTDDEFLKTQVRLSGQGDGRLGMRGLTPAQLAILGHP